MNKDKVGAEPKSKRIKRYYSKGEIFHIGVNRDEWCCYRSKYYPVTAIGGYFFTYGDWWAKRCSVEIVKERWDVGAFGSNGYKTACFAVVDRNRKIAIIKRDNRNVYSLTIAIPRGFTIYKVEEIPCFNPFDKSNKRLLYKEIVKTMIIQLMEYYRDEYKVINGNSKVCNSGDFTKREKEKKRKEIEDFTNKFGKYFPTKKPIIEFTYIGDYKVKFPSVEDVINNKLFTDEELTHIAKCKFYTKYIYNKGNSYKWKDVDNNWNKVADNKLTWQENLEIELKEKHEKALAHFNECRKRVAENIKRLREEALRKDDIKNFVDYWRTKNNIFSTYIEYKDCRLLSNDMIEWFNSKISLDGNQMFDNTQLKLKGNNVVTSKGAVVKLDDAINLFNKLYIKYLVKKDEDSVIFTNNVSIGVYRLRFIHYREKTTDDGKPLGYKEWLIQIGCHSLWFDDVKDFARYYNLQDRLNFPLDKTTDECRDNNLIHLIKRNNNDRK